MMTILYKCHCMAAEAAVEVAERRDGEDILDWMQHVQMAIGVDHRKRSVLCMATALEYAKIPVPEGSPAIGVKPRLN